MLLAWPATSMPHAHAYTRSDALGTDVRYSSRSNPVPDILQIRRHAGVGVLSLRRAPNLGKLARATRIPAPGPISSSLTLTLSPCGICRLTPPRENTTTDGFFSLFGSQYKVLLDLLGDLFDVILFAVCSSRSDELWVYDQDYL